MSRSEAHDQRNAGIKDAFMKPFEFASSTPPTAELVPTEAKNLELAHYVEDVPNSGGARVHWLGNPKPQKILLYFHGGGFAIPPLPGHARFWKQTVDQLEKQGKGLTVAVVEYSLTSKDGSGSRYPVQIKQAVESLRYILEKGNTTSNIIIGGDSAGGQLALAIISVILHGFQGIEPLKLDEPLAGMLLISPWVSYQTDNPSWKENKDKDIVPAECLHILTDAYLDSGDRNNFSEPHQADVSWWRNIPAKSILNVYGGYECFRDDIAEVGKALKDAGNQVQNVACAKQVHIDCVLDAQAEMEPGDMSHEIWNWLSSVV